MNNKIFVACHQGLGDHLICNGLYRSLSEKYDEVIIPVKKKYAKTLNRMLCDLKNIKIYDFPSDLTDDIISIYLKILPKFKYTKLRLGNYDFNFLKGSMRFDENFYFQAKINFDMRWEKFYFKRNIKLENELYNFFQIRNQKYIFLHEDVQRGFNIDRKYLSKKLKIVSTSIFKRNYDIFDYYKLIENATELHCIESSFAAFIEGLGQISGKKFAHRYARPEAISNWRSEFTYKNKWNIIMKNI